MQPKQFWPKQRLISLYFHKPLKNTAGNCRKRQTPTNPGETIGGTAPRPAGQRLGDAREGQNVIHPPVRQRDFTWTKPAGLGGSQPHIVPGQFGEGCSPSSPTWKNCQTHSGPFARRILGHLPDAFWATCQTHSGPLARRILWGGIR